MRSAAGSSKMTVERSQSERDGSSDGVWTPLHVVTTAAAVQMETTPRAISPRLTQPKSVTGVK